MFNTTTAFTFLHLYVKSTTHSHFLHLLLLHNHLLLQTSSGSGLASNSTILGDASGGLLPLLVDTGTTIQLQVVVPSTYASGAVSQVPIFHHSQAAARRISGPLPSPAWPILLGSRFLCPSWLHTLWGCVGLCPCPTVVCWTLPFPTTRTYLVVSTCSCIFICIQSFHLRVSLCAPVNICFCWSD